MLLEDTKTIPVKVGHQITGFRAGWNDEKICCIHFYTGPIENNDSNAKDVKASC